MDKALTEKDEQRQRLELAARAKPHPK